MSASQLQQYLENPPVGMTIIFKVSFSTVLVINYTEWNLVNGHLIATCNKEVTNIFCKYLLITFIHEVICMILMQKNSFKMIPSLSLLLEL